MNAENKDIPDRPETLNALLSTHDYFKRSNSKKLISCAIGIATKILYFNQKNTGASSISRKIFKRCYGDNYAQILSAMEDCGLVEITRYTEKKTTTDKGKCYSYFLTERCLLYLSAAFKAESYAITCNPKERRKNQIRISKRGYNQIHYGDVRDSIKQTIDGVARSLESKATLDKVHAIADQYPPLKQTYTRNLVARIQKREYDSLSFNEKDGRISNPYTQLPKEVKAALQINGMTYQDTIDIRSCYPSLFAEYICSLGNVSIELQTERHQYNSIFLNKDIEPKDYLSTLLQIDRQEIKDVLIQYFNGHRISKAKNNPFHKFNAWLKESFPLLYATWRATDIKQTGNNIGRNFETKLMLDGSIYDKAKELGIIIGYENDGLSFYARDNTNINELVRYIESRSVELLDIQLVIVRKRVSVFDFINKPEVLRLFEQATDNRMKMNRIRGRCWHSKKWDAYYNLKDTNSNLVNRIRTLINKIEADTN